MHICTEINGYALHNQHTEHKYNKMGGGKCKFIKVSFQCLMECRMKGDGA